MLRAGFVEKMGSGIKRIRELVPKVKFEISSNWFRVVFDRNADNKVGSKVTPNQNEIINLMSENPHITKNELFEKLDI